MTSSEDEARLRSWLEAQDSTRQTVPMPGPVMSELIRMTNVEAAEAAMTADGITELFKIAYSRVAAFAAVVEEFAELRADTR